MPTIKSYHPSFVVRNGTAEHVIEATVDDWASDEDVLRALGDEYGCRTAGELVEAMLGGVGPARVVESAEYPQQVCVNGRPCLKWDDKLVA